MLREHMENLVDQTVRRIRCRGIMDALCHKVTRGAGRRGVALVLQTPLQGHLCWDLVEAGVTRPAGMHA